MIGIHDTVPAFSSISLGFTAAVSTNHSGDINGSPPRWITFAFDDTLSDLTSTTSDILADQYWAVDLLGINGNFQSEPNNIYTINPLYFQLDTKPGNNKFRMTQITKGFGLQYLENTALEYRSNQTNGCYTYTAAYIGSGHSNTVNNPSNQVGQLAEVACQEIFPSPSPTVLSYNQSGTYNSCWNYAPDQTYECYSVGANPEVSGAPLFYPPVSYMITEPVNPLPSSTTPYCTIDTDITHY